MIVGVRQGDNAEDIVTSVLLFQAVIGEATLEKSPGLFTLDFVAMCILDYFSIEGKNVPDHELISIILHVACSELKGAGVENVLAFCRVTQSCSGARKSQPSTLPKFILDRLGFCSTASCQTALECEFYSLFEECQTQFFPTWDCPLRVVTFGMDSGAMSLTRFVPVSSKNFAPLFAWNDMTLVWVEEFNNLVMAKEKQLFEDQVSPRDR